MRKLSAILGILLLAGLVAGGVLLLSWDIPPPTERVEKVIPNARFQP
ncbi:MAG: hypothetical protein HOH66_02810 [Rhodospirillaceae bacterium]|jgi:hypothetical protein|nr:hypothetical protein [Rhodospirillaceae bacterium]